MFPGASTIGLPADILLLFFNNVNVLNDITLADGINHVKAFHHLAKAGVVTVKMCGVVAAVADKKLRPARIPSGMGHAQHTSVVVLVSACQLTFDFVTRASGTIADGTAPLDHEVGDDPVKREPVVKSLLAQVNEVLYGVWGVLFVELHLHHTL
jgi:hypothetical protein